MSEFEHCGYPCEVRMTHLFHRCGYVKVPKGHPAYGKGWNDDIIDMLSVHGGVTYAADEEDGYWTLGFDCAHMGDMPDLYAMEAAHDEGEISDEEYDTLRKYAAVIEPSFLEDFFGLPPITWTEEMVIDETMEMAEQLRKMEGML